MVEDINISSPVATSDHNVINFKLIYDTEIEENKKKVFDYYHGDYEAISNVMMGEDWECRLRGMDMEEMWKEFLTKFLECRDKFVPERKEKKRKGPLWMKPKILRKIKQRGRAWKKYADLPQYDLKEKYRKIRNIITAEIKSAKREYENKVANEIKEDPKSFYAYIRS